LLIPGRLVEADFPYFQHEEIGAVDYVKVPANDLVRLLGPFDARRFDFGRNAVVVTEPPEAGQFQAVVRVYDRFGKAAGAECSVTLSPEPGTIRNHRMRRREEIV
jgi:hypothetical protein